VIGENTSGKVYIQENIRQHWDEGQERITEIDGLTYMVSTGWVNWGQSCGCSEKNEHSMRHIDRIVM